MTCRVACRVRERGEAAPVAWIAARPVREWMRHPVVTITPETDLRAAAALMRERRVGALPVVDAAGHVVGILMEGDLLEATIR